ncbi:MAG: hypothetical protein AB7O97_21990 [Planctomycetota bacterium]
MARRTRGFPVGLYGTLLLALCWLLLPELLRPVERLLLGVACLPQRFMAHAGGQPALAATAHRRDQLLQLQRGLQDRSRAHDLERGRELLPPALEPLLCRVRAVDGRGGAGVPCELVLDRSYDELAGCVDLVTCGDTLLGFLARPGIGPARDDLPSDPARVLLLNHPRGREVAVRLQLGDGDLNCVVGAAAVVDPAALRTTLHDDPYRAARMRQGSAPVWTLPADAPWIGALPGGLRVGTTRIWGYDIGGDVLTIGVYVDPEFDPRALPQVVVWQSVPGPADVRTDLPWTPAQAWALPDGTGGRWLVTAARSLPDGAAVVQDGVCLGTLRGVAFGQGLCTSFAASRHTWSVWLLPDDPSAAPVGLFGQVAFAEGPTAWFRPRVGRKAGDPMLPAGFVFTGSNGPYCPSGLLLGRAEPDLLDGEWLLRIAVPARTGAQDVQVAAGAIGEVR